jgi:hypothetical protein
MLPTVIGAVRFGRRRGRLRHTARSEGGQTGTMAA